MQITSTTWIKSDSKDNAAATAEKVGGTGNEQCLDSVVASFTSPTSASKLLTVRDGATTILEYYISPIEPRVTIPLYGIVCGTTVSAVLAASGEAGNYGKVALIGHPR